MHHCLRALTAQEHNVHGAAVFMCGRVHVFGDKCTGYIVSWTHLLRVFAHLNPHSYDFGDVCALHSPFLHQLTMQSSLFEPGRPVLVVVCVARKLRPCPSYSRRRDRINLGHWRSLYKGGGTKLDGTT